MKNSKIIKNKTIYFLSLLAGLLFVLSETEVVVANPEGGVVSAGSATIITTPDSKNVSITQSSDKAVIDWHSFNIAADEKTQFIQPSSSSITLNRIDAAQGASTILGNLNANGHIWLINPAGILFGASAQVDVAGLLATTAQISNQDFMSGQYKFMQSPDFAGTIVNEGTIHAKDAGIVMLVAPWVQNTGTIQTNQGEVFLGSSAEPIVDFYGDHLISFDANGSTSTSIKTGVSESGAIIADAGNVTITAGAAERVLDNVINTSGYTQATTISTQNGEIILGDATATVSGHIQASGGTVKVLGHKVELTDNATIDVSGKTGGGTILIGGNAHGAGSEKNAEDTFVGKDVNLYADALESGNGGKVVVWSDATTRFYGHIFARGAQGGQGGFVETSGKEFLDVAGARVLAGSWLLDPRNIVIDTASTTCTTPSCFSSENPTIYTPDTNTSHVNVNDILAALETGTSVTITTGTTGTQTGTIQVNTPITKTTGTIPVTLTLDSSQGGGTITIGNNNHITSTSGALGITLLSGNNITINANITTNGGDFFSNSQNTTTLSGNRIIDVGSGTVTINANQSGIGSQNFTMNAGSAINSTNNTANAVAITVNTPDGTGTGAAQLRDITTGSGGTITINTSTANTGNSGADITQSSGILTADTINLVTSQMGSRNVGTSGSNITVNANTINITTGSGGAFITNTGANAFNLGTINTTGDLQLTSLNSSAITESGSLTVGGTATFTAGALQNITLDAANNHIAALSITSGNNVTLVNADALDLKASTVSGNFNITAGGDITDSGNQIITGTATFNTSSDIILDKTGNNFSTVVVTGANNVTLIDTNDLMLGAMSITGNLNITADNVTQSGALSVGGTSRFSAGGHAITLNNANNHFIGTISLNNSGANDVAITSGNTPLIIDTSNIGRNLTITSGGSISQTGAITATNGTITLSATSPDTDILLDTQANKFGNSPIVFSETVSNIRDVGLQNTSSNAVLPNFTGLTNLRNVALNFTSSNIILPSLTLTNGGNLTVNARGASGFAIAQTGALVVPGTSTFITTTGSSGARDIILTNSDNQLTGAVSVDNGGASADVNIVNSTELVLGSISIGSGNLTLEGIGISQTGSITQTGTGAANFIGNAGAINLTNHANQLSGTVTLSNTGAHDINLATGNDLNIGTSTSGGKLTIVSDAGLTLSGNLTSNVSAGDAIVLSTGTAFDNGAGYTLNTSGGRFLIWSQNSANNNLGGLVYSFKQYNATYGITPVQGTGSGLLYTLAPNVTASLTGNTEKVYDATTNATLNSNNYTVSGAIEGDVVTLNNPTLGAYDTKDVGTNKNVSVSGLSVAGASHGNIAVYGYQLTSSIANAPIGDITPAPLTITIDSGQTKIYGTNDPSSGFSYTAQGLLGSDVISGHAGRTAGENVGTYAYTSGNLDAGSNYTTQFVTNDNYTITPATINIMPTPDQGKIIGSPDPELTYNSTGVIDNVTPLYWDSTGSYHATATINNTLSGYLQRSAGEQTGSYSYSLGTLTVTNPGNYTFHLTPGSFTILSIYAIPGINPRIILPKNINGDIMSIKIDITKSKNSCIIKIDGQCIA